MSSKRNKGKDKSSGGGGKSGSNSVVASRHGSDDEADRDHESGEDGGAGTGNEDRSDDGSDERQLNDYADDPMAAALANRENESQILADKIADLLEAVTEKRATTREQALEDWKKLLSFNVLDALLDGKIETLLEYLKKNLRKGTDLETKNAAYVVALLFLILGPGNEQIFNEFRPILQELIRTRNTDTSKPACLDCIGISCFIGSTEATTTTSTLEFFEEIFSRNYSSEVEASAINSWCLLATTLSPNTVNVYSQRVIKQLRKHLSSDDNELRIASGIAIALIFEILVFDEIQIEMNEETRESLMSTLTDLANDSNRHKAKKERSKQRSVFRDILKTIQGNESPSLLLKFKHEVVEYDSWTRIRQIESFRSLLGQGFHVHFLLNDVVRQIFDLPPAILASENTPQKLTSIQKRMMYSPNSEANRARSKWLDNKRRNKSAAAHQAIWSSE